MTMIRVCYLITELSIGGAQIATYRLLSGLDRSRFLPSVACWYNGDGHVAQQIRGLGIDVHDLRMTNKLRVDAFGRLYGWLGEKKPHILHTIMFHSNIPGRVIGRLRGVPIVISAEQTMRQESNARYRLNRLTARYADVILCVSEQVALAAVNEIGLPQEKVVTIPNGVDWSQFAVLPSKQKARQRAGLPQTGLIVGAVGRPRPVKGYPFLLASWPDVVASYPQALLLFVGDGPDRPALQAQAKQLGIWDNVIFWGDRDDIPQLLPALDLLAVPSMQEGLSLVILEAMAAGLPVVATNVGGNPELVRHEQTGLLVPPRDSSALAGAVKRLFGDAAARVELGDAGRKRIEADLTMDKIVEMTETLYEQLVARKFGRIDSGNAIDDI